MKKAVEGATLVELRVGGGGGQEWEGPEPAGRFLGRPLQGIVALLL